MRTETNVIQQTKDTLIENEMILKINLAYYSLIYLITFEWKDTLDLLVYCGPQPNNTFTLISPCYFSCLFWNWKHLFTLSLQNTDWCQSRSHLGHSNKVHGCAAELIACCIWYSDLNQKQFQDKVPKNQLDPFQESQPLILCTLIMLIPAEGT